ncbi:MAG: zinc metalloprotease HtpX [Alphaproteobacteria bacterium]|nr:zinc metalloprotease HtpX [Alphaproteobacteria bacterium]
MGKIKTFCLMAGLMLIFMYVGNLFGGVQGMKTAFIISLALNFYSYFFSDKLVLKHYKAQEVNKNNAPMLYQIVENLSQKANLPMPKVYIVPDDVPNAFATGRNPKHAAVAATQGLLNLLDENEIEGVLAHELSHVKHYDILTGSIAAVFAGAIAMISNMARYNVSSRNNNSNNRSNGLFAVLAVVLLPIAASVIRFGVSRTREYEADEGAANLTQKPQYLASALAKLEGYAKNYSLNKATSETAHMFIINPFSAQKADFSSLFSTHPSTADRIRRLKALEDKYQ